MIQPIAIRFAVYTLAIFGFSFALPQVDHGDHAVFHEDGPIEWAQFLCLGLAAAALGVRAWITRRFGSCCGCWPR